MNEGIRKIFSEVPPTYELVNHFLTGGMDILWRKRAARLGAGGGGSLWMDVCTGTGETAIYLRRLAPKETTLVAADFCLPMARKAFAKPEAGGIRFLLADAGLLPFADRTFDLITISFSTRNLNVDREHLIGCFREFHRLLKPGGRFLNLETSQPPSRTLRKMMHFYVRLTVEPVGRFISGSKTAYSYLSRSMRRFYSAEELADILRLAGFAEVTYRHMLFGAAALHEGLK